MIFRKLVFAASSVALAAASGLRELQQPSAKFTATWETEPVVAASCLNTDNNDTIWGDSTYFDYCDDLPAAEDHSLGLVGLGLLKVPQQKEVLIGLSAQVAIFTLNTATSKKPLGSDSYYGNIGATKAMAGVAVTLYAENVDSEEDPMECVPGKVTLDSRFVELRNRIGGNATYEDCWFNATGSFICVTKIADLELESSVGIAMETVSASSFQFVCPNLDSGTYTILAQFELTSMTEDLCEDSPGGDCSLISDPAVARVILGKRMLTAQTVRAVQGTLEVD